MGRHQMGGPEPRRQRQFGSMQRRACGDRGLPPAIEAFEQARSAFQGGEAAFAACRTNKAIAPATLEHEGGAARLAREGLLELRKRTGGGHQRASWRPRDPGHSKHYM